MLMTRVSAALAALTMVILPMPAYTFVLNVKTMFSFAKTFVKSSDGNADTNVGPLVAFRWYVAVLAGALPSLTLIPMLDAPEFVAVNVAPASAELILEALPVSCIPLVPASASITLPSVPLVVVKLTMRLAESASATVKSAKAAATPIPTD